MIEALRLGCFLGFLTLGLRLWKEGRGAGRRRRVDTLIGYVLVVSLAVGVLQKDAWPFSSHTIAVGRARADSRICQTQLFGVDGAGREWRLDPYAFTPVFDSILQYWLEQAPGRLSEDAWRRSLAFLLQRAEESRRRLAAHRAVGPQRLLGLGGAPYWLLLPRRLEVPPEPYVALRGYSTCWIVADALDPSAREMRQRVFEHPGQ